MRLAKLMGWVLALSLAAAGCKKTPRAPDGNELTASGHEIPEPVDDSVIDKEDVDPPKPEVK
ncbi:MAG: hypothetical protein JWN04_1939 [Myxococcaceae bacterium]|nr:hypothetical protein [Myxococcaceae bacterium]